MNCPPGAVRINQGISQIDENFIATTGIAEKLILSRYPGKIYLLPALPSAWMNGTAIIKVSTVLILENSVDFLALLNL